MSIDHAIPAQTGFQVGATWAPFRVRRDGDGTYPDWMPDLVSTTRKVPGSNSSVTWFDGWGLARLTLGVSVESRAHYLALLRLTGWTGTLQLLAAFTSHDDAASYHHPADGRDYDRYGDTTLLEAPARVRHLVGGAVECELTFGRAFAPGAVS